MDSQLTQQKTDQQSLDGAFPDDSEMLFGFVIFPTSYGAVPALEGNPVDRWSLYFYELLMEKSVKTLEDKGI